MWLRDEQRMFNQVLPLAAERAKIADTSFIAEASKANFVRYLTAAQKLSVEERAEVVPIFTPWAQATGPEAENLLRLFAEGRPLPRTLRSYFKQGKSLLRPLAQRLHAAFERR
jgi:hypothetical protein